MDTGMLRLWMIQPDKERFPASNIKVIVWAFGREDAKRKANASWLHNMGNPENFICTPITNPGDKVKLDITLNI